MIVIYRRHFIDRLASIDYGVLETALVHDDKSSAIESNVSEKSTKQSTVINHNGNSVPSDSTSENTTTIDSGNMLQLVMTQLKQRLLHIKYFSLMK